MNGLCLHVDSEETTWDDILKVNTPPPTDSHFPIAHDRLLTKIEDQLTASGYNILERKHALSQAGKRRSGGEVIHTEPGMRYFGIYHVARADASPEQLLEKGYSWSLGIRNSHDKSFSAGLAAGTRVFVCDNLCFSGLINVSRKHTRFGDRDFQGLVAKAIGKLDASFRNIDELFAGLRECEINDSDANDTIIEAVVCDALSPSSIMPTVELWRRPEKEEFQPRTAWSLFNAITSAQARKPVNPNLTIARGDRLHGLFANRFVPTVEAFRDQEAAEEVLDDVETIDV